MTLHRDDLATYLDDYLDVGRFQDYCPNGLQVAGRSEIRRIVTGVTASQRLIDEAIERQADAILVHHGYFWKGEPAPITGIKRNRLAALANCSVGRPKVPSVTVWFGTVGSTERKPVPVCGSH